MLVFYARGSCRKPSQILLTVDTQLFWFTLVVLLRTRISFKDSVSELVLLGGHESTKSYDVYVILEKSH